MQKCDLHSMKDSTNSTQNDYRFIFLIKCKALFKERMNYDQLSEYITFYAFFDRNFNKNRQKISNFRYWNNMLLRKPIIQTDFKNEIIKSSKESKDTWSRFLNGTNNTDEILVQRIFLVRSWLVLDYLGRHNHHNYCSQAWTKGEEFTHVAGV